MTDEHEKRLRDAVWEAADGHDVKECSKDIEPCPLIPALDRLCAYVAAAAKVAALRGVGRYTVKLGNGNNPPSMDRQYPDDQTQYARLGEALADAEAALARIAEDDQQSEQRGGR